MTDHPGLSVCCTYCGYTGPAKSGLTYCLTRHEAFCPCCGYMALPLSLAGPSVGASVERTPRGRVMAESICICGRYSTGCDRKCAGSLAQQLECEQVGHLTAPPHLGFMDPEFCHRCGHRPAKDQATR